MAAERAATTAANPGRPLRRETARACAPRTRARSWPQHCATLILVFVIQVDLASNLDTVLREVGAFRMGESPVQRAAAELAQRLEEAGIDYAIADALCLGAHGVVRATEDVDVLITREGLQRFKAQWIGRGYIDLRPGGKAVRDTVHRVKIDFLLSGDFPGDGRPKPISFPEPAAVGVPAGELRVVSLPRFVELKLASGMTAGHRLQDLADVLRLIEKLELPAEFAEQLDPWVRAKFAELWRDAQHVEDDY
jgi:hypothetical protein